MSKLSKKVCPACGSIFQKRSETHEYCSGACRTKAFRQRNEMEEPSFLHQSKKSEESSFKKESSSDATKVSHENISDFSAIGITEYIPNPAYVRIAKEYSDCVKHTLELQSKREALQSEINLLNGTTAKIVGAFLGGLVVLAGGYAYMLFQTKKGNVIKKTLFWILLIPTTIIGIVAGGALSVLTYFGSEKVQKLAKANEKEVEVLVLDQEILISQDKEKLLAIERDAIQKQIAKYDKVNQEGDYIPFEDVTPLKVTTLESLKNKKFKTLDFSGKWKDLVGTPEANFCLMVYGKPGQGKSYFTLELSEYLAHHFGKVLFNSSEEGSSLSLQNKINHFDMENIYLGDAKDITSLQYLLTQSPYKFVVIDSINHMSITPEDLRKLRGLHPDKGFICILQSTKSGDFKGGNEFEHDADISIRIDKRVADCKKTRYQ
ncbi:hypothetical protein LV89_04971 [Arcicella aurantiaca]|uniref:Uncharacterized protein n=1 Tax=Arcicella aurantiaca TaxID=591202 RepID=A0A316DDP6_9BACT|nr:hypothetical protein [Arcicella aurantiaca]PWK15748.1 hypothetical protein LV89_04971 [Arcicella aurantiaca]